MGSLSGRAVGYQVRGPGFKSQSGPNQFIIAPPCPPSTKWETRSLKLRSGGSKGGEESNGKLPDSPMLELFYCMNVRPSKHLFTVSLYKDVGGTVDRESILRAPGTLLSRVRAPPQAPWPDGGPESLRSHVVVRLQKPNFYLCIFCFGISVVRNLADDKIKCFSSFSVSIPERVLPPCSCFHVADDSDICNQITITLDR
ncbi:hypothetical protein PoB_001455000 [Plakobranchus ocellatus]|uniref:Uncharacterized protein n=1 Tax=Plakobranchus ocellatus TaxID=259542 RepID=A0AAV3Z069_9GAST|nr:hypothetical protein PoB_001455000 [Plakobranchus ocellatus]